MKRYVPPLYRIVKIGRTITLLLLLFYICTLKLGAFWVVSPRVIISVESGCIVHSSIVSEKWNGIGPTPCIGFAWNELGMVIIPNSRRVGLRQNVYLPLWIAPLATGIFTILAARRHRKWQIGKCGFCGYDLTGNMSGVCPECGKFTERKPSGLTPNL